MKKYLELVWEFTAAFVWDLVSAIFSVLIYVAVYYAVLQPFWGIILLGIVVGLVAVFFVKAVIETIIRDIKNWGYTYTEWQWEYFKEGRVAFIEKEISEHQKRIEKLEREKLEREKRL